MKCSDKNPCNKFNCPDCQNDRFRKQYEMRREAEKECVRLEREVIDAYKLAQEARRNAAVDCYEIAAGYLRSCTGSAVAAAIKVKFGLEI